MAEVLDLDTLASKPRPVKFSDSSGKAIKFDAARVSFNVGLRIIQHSAKFSVENMRPLLELAQRGTAANDEEAQRFGEVIRAMLEIIEAMLVDQGTSIGTDELEKCLSFVQIVALIECITEPVMKYLQASKGLVGIR